MRIAGTPSVPQPSPGSNGSGKAGVSAAGSCSAEDESVACAAGALGPPGLVVGVFVDGGDAVVPAWSRCSVTAERHARGDHLLANATTRRHRGRPEPDHPSPAMLGWSAAEGVGEIDEPVGLEQAVERGRTGLMRARTPFERSADEDRAKAEAGRRTKV